LGHGNLNDGIIVEEGGEGQADKGEQVKNGGFLLSSLRGRRFDRVSLLLVLHIWDDAPEPVELFDVSARGRVQPEISVYLYDGPGKVIKDDVTYLKNAHERR
jgi:hypothetical protein